MAEHKFRIDQRVTLAINIINRSAAGGSYVVTKQLPERNGEFEYRIKSISEPHERVALESELARA
jgi:predicted transcriptional regulator